jgi:hypothetical protein
MDGTHGDVECRWAGRSVVWSGVNAYPDRFDQFCGAVKRLVGSKTKAFLLGTLVFVAALGAGVALLDGWGQVVTAFWLGAMVTALVFGWLLGFDARSLKWQRGALGEMWTGEELDRLGSGWHVVHDLADGRGNWDHIVVGPPGVFAIDSKNFLCGGDRRSGVAD